MIRSYVFGCHEQIKSFRTFTVNVALPDHVIDVSRAQKAAITKAEEMAAQHGLRNPTLIHESGVPDLRIILEKGEVTAVYCRNTDVVPLVTVEDLDYAEKPEIIHQALVKELNEGGYTLVSHFVE